MQVGDSARSSIWIGILVTASAWSTAFMKVLEQAFYIRALMMSTTVQISNCQDRSVC